MPHRTAMHTGKHTHTAASGTMPHRAAMLRALPGETRLVFVDDHATTHRVTVSMSLSYDSCPWMHSGAKHPTTHTEAVRGTRGIDLRPQRR